MATSKPCTFDRKEGRPHSEICWGETTSSGLILNAHGPNGRWATLCGEEGGQKVSGRGETEEGEGANDSREQKGKPKNVVPNQQHAHTTQGEKGNQYPLYEDAPRGKGLIKKHL